MSHLDPGLLHELLDGEIPSADLAPIQAHLASCEECRARLEYERQLQSDADGLVAAIELPPVADHRCLAPSNGRPARRGVPDSHGQRSLILAVGLGYLVRGPGSAPVAHQETLAVPGSSGAQAIPATPPRRDTAIATATKQAAPAGHVNAPASREALALQQQKTGSGTAGGPAGTSQRDVRDQVAAKAAAGAPTANQPAAGTIAAAHSGSGTDR